MLKIKYLHRRFGKSNRDTWKYKRDNTTDLFSDLPYRQSIRGEYNRWGFFDISPLYEFLDSKIGCDWNDIYSEIVKKVKKKYRYDIDYSIDHSIKNVIYDEDYIPRTPNGRMIYDRLYVDFNNILCYRSKEETLRESKKNVRYQKLKEIIENQEIKQQEDQSED